MRRSADVPGALKPPRNPLGVAMAAVGSDKSVAHANSCERSEQIRRQPSSQRPVQGREHIAPSSAGHPTLAAWQVNRAKQMMLTSIGTTISIPDVAARCRLSAYYFVRAFANTMGVPPYSWYLQQRIVRAQQLLFDAGLPLAQVALECGFADQAHFTKAFSKATGSTPARWRLAAICKAQAVA